MTKDELNQYRSLKREVEELNKKIKSSQTQVNVKASSLEKRKLSCIKQCSEIEQYIFHIEDSLIRRIFVYRYIEGRHRMSWQRIATEIGEQDEQYPRRVHNRYLQKR